MIPIADLPDVVPVFPLPGALLLPRARLPLQVFEPRYLAMLDDVLKTSHRLIGMIQPYARPENSNGLHMIGCAGRVTSFSETDDGRYMITLTGVSRFRITQELDSFTPYRRCNVNWAGFDRDLGVAEKDPGFDRAPFLKMLGRFFEDKSLSTDWDSLGDADDELLINSLAMLCPFDPEDKQALLEAPSLTTRRETLITLIQFALRGGSGDEILQ
ncbi:ATP-dependent protease [Loktanella sp. D2R18]|uniref:LON peptidase substrate-binding domain-containing protein n=1 Tax=Rhodobacterales TaxID=204455 RepID=UPI000DEADB55|nr:MULTISPECIES: LON peptidase substrate-binding domain-containing protein [Rhodobacterales]MDO6591298.1 LON peptidase substrate-binding domain-containing protein [Yoonia sp. 1_MG-2023]RBW46250.1 ATP-dependent protease [Loktanella sp. D2R18]